MNRHIVISMLCFFMITVDLCAQTNARTGNDNTDTAQMIFEYVQTNIAADRAKNISAHFANQVYINVRGEEGGYFSANQGIIILQNFFSLHHVVTFKLSTVNTTHEQPYATGAGTFFSRGKKENLQIYIGLTPREGGWFISQFNVY